MSKLIQDDSAVSVVVGAILLLAILVTFLSVVTSTWVPIYEGDAEAQHSEVTKKTFLTLTKQIENANEFPDSTKFNLGTEGIQLIRNSYSVGYFELNDTASPMTITTNVTMEAESDLEYGYEVRDMNTSIEEPVTNFLLEFEQGSFDRTRIIPNEPDWTINPNFELTLTTSRLDRIIKLESFEVYRGGWFMSPGEGEKKLRITYEYDPVLGSAETWVGESEVEDQSDDIYVDDLDVFVNMLSDLPMELTSVGSVTINNTTYNQNEQTSLANVTQYYMSLPKDGTGGNYFIEFDESNPPSEVNRGDVYMTYVPKGDSIPFEVNNGTVTGVMDNFTIGGGALALRSDYNFMVDQFYSYDNGAVILQQDDGAVFVVDPPISVNVDSNSDLWIGMRTTVLHGNYSASGNTFEILYTELAQPEYEVKGTTENITINKSTTTRTKDLWLSFFNDLKEEIEDTGIANVTINATNSSYIDVEIYDGNLSDTKEMIISLNKRDILVTS